MNNNKWYKKPEMIVALSALLISLVTAAVGIYSAYIDRSYARASVWPRLEVSRSFGGEYFEYGITNSGNGPALIKYAVIQYKSKPIKYWRDIPSLPNFTQSHLGTRILSSQNSIKPIVYRGKAAKSFLDTDEFIEIEICYCSIYEECWLINRVNEPKPVDNCHVTQERAFLQ
ncbi:hypothetical protein RI845_00430 [Thalassotalea nanhaiensis]|uniref:Type IV pilin n=1 Tax=Thalassotalea nanhaiensis TaxID=3065648 RepID=A0ABY9TLH3_9GAMM|nr:hypothetical protein RI845_00430 [Colwelliaceae bacterium SQ345]